MNSADALASSHITQGSIYTLRRPNPRFEDIELFVDAYVPPNSSEDGGIHQFMDNHNKWEESLNTAGVNDMGSSYTLTTDNTNNSTNESIKSDFGIRKRQS